MKLKKIASLMLAGVMAVSMLAGCSTKSNEEENGGNTEVKPTTSNAVTVMNDAQSAVKFEANSDFDAALAAAAKKAAHEDVKDAKYTVAPVGTKNDVNKELAKKLDVDANLIDDNDDIWFNALKESADKGGRSAVVTGLWIVKADGLTEKAALEQIANDMKGKVTGQNTESADQSGQNHNYNHIHFLSKFLCHGHNNCIKHARFCQHLEVEEREQQHKSC